MQVCYYAVRHHYPYLHRDDHVPLGSTSLGIKDVKVKIPGLYFLGSTPLMCSNYTDPNCSQIPPKFAVSLCWPTHPLSLAWGSTLLLAKGELLIPGEVPLLLPASPCLLVLFTAPAVPRGLGPHKSCQKTLSREAPHWSEKNDLLPLLHPRGRTALAE